AEPRVGWPAAARPWLASRNSPAQLGADRLVPPTIANGASPGRLYGSAIQAPVSGSATSDTSGEVRKPVDCTACCQAGSASYWLRPPPLPMNWSPSAAEL